MLICFIVCLMQENPSPFAFKDQPKSYGSFNISNDKYTSINGNDTIPNHDKDDVSYKDGLERTSYGHILNNELYYKDADIGNPIPKPRSVRRRHGKAPSSHDDVGNVVDVEVVKRKSRGRRRCDSKRGQQLLVDSEYPWQCWKLENFQHCPGYFLFIPLAMLEVL
ncbi:hypothetical protein Dsin_020379 [Dipteronia sinensis]|uniref:Uncharacterized protein n=1 Tax=Dipteronia sinensis TaxID=43782 RepID=A0AAE0AAA1_9ROSI|nr:hypothetical protein Dsin_020379 [Dipteronia sinensis]